jgi:hypothetical protein
MRHRKIRRSIVSRWLVGLVLCSYMGTAIGFPLPFVAAAPSPTTHACHCGNVADCCCARPGVPSGAPVASCCRRAHPPTSAPAICPAPKTPTSHPVVPCSKLPRYSPLGCQCQGTLWVIHGTTAPPPPFDWKPCHAGVEQLSYPAVLARVHRLPPPVPPPRIYA